MDRFHCRCLSRPICRNLFSFLKILRFHWRICNIVCFPSASPCWSVPLRPLNLGSSASARKDSRLSWRTFASPRKRKSIMDNKCFRFQTSRLYQGMGMPPPRQNIHEERTWSGKYDLVCLHLLPILTDQSHISGLCLLSSLDRMKSYFLWSHNTDDKASPWHQL